LLISGPLALFLQDAPLIPWRLYQLQQQADGQGKDSYYPNCFSHGAGWIWQLVNTCWQ